MNADQTRTIKEARERLFQLLEDPEAKLTPKEDKAIDNIVQRLQRLENEAT